MSFGKTVNLGNSIIGVSILAMPYCFVQSGLILSILLIVLSGFLTRLSCHFLLKSAFISKRRSFELMVHDVLGSTGRIMVEIGLIGFLLGTCVAYFIMIGDLAPKMVAELLDIKYTRNLRLISVIFLGLLVALPLSLFKRVDSLTSFSLLSMILYSCLILKLMFETTDKLVIDRMIKDNFDKISYWNISGLLTTFPIFSMAMSCQASLFEIFDNSVMTNDLDTIKRDNNTIKQAIYMCSFVYITVGLLGYMAFHDQTLYGNILLAFQPSTTTTLTKIGFITSLLMSFPLCLFPCRTSVHSLTIGKLKRSHNFHALPSLPSPTSTTITGVTSTISPSNILKDFSCDLDPNNNHHPHLNEACHQKSLLAPMNRLVGNHSRISNEIGDGMNGNLGSRDQLIEQTSSLPNGLSLVNLHPTSSKLYISDFQFRLLTIILITITVVLSLMFPHIEFILGIIGSTAGTTVCFVLPAFTFIRIGSYSKTELLLARMLLIIGITMLVFCTYSTISNARLNVPTE